MKSVVTTNEGPIDIRGTNKPISRAMINIIAIFCMSESL